MWTVSSFDFLIVDYLITDSQQLSEMKCPTTANLCRCSHPGFPQPTMTSRSWGSTGRKGRNIIRLGETEEEMERRRRS